MAIVAAMLAVACIGVYLFTAGPFGRKTIPSFEGITTAADAEARLAGSGIPVVRRQEFSRHEQGAFLGLDGLESGQQVSHGDEVTIVESLGPGVPEGTVGSTRDQAVEQVKDMGVAVTVVPVASSASAGTVVKSSPDDGKPVDDKDGGITLAVASEDQGIPMELAGMELEQARQQLESQGFTVKTQARVASKGNVGKVVAADPSIGTVTKGGNVTLYYGVDAEGLKESMVRMNPGIEGKTYTDLRAMLGTWCNDNGDCHTITATDPDTMDDESYAMSVRLDEDKNDDAASLSVFPMGGDAGSMVVNEDNKAMARTLIMGDTGAVELYDNAMMPTCGTAVVPFRSYCKNGVVATYSGDERPISTGLSIGMKDYVVVIPVGTDVAALERQEYFADQPKTDSDETRPYILVRDASLYDAAETSYTYDAKMPASAGDIAMLPNPFVPTAESDPIAFKPAPSAEAAYYYVETPIDWDALAKDGEQVCSEDGCDATPETSTTQESTAEPARSTGGLSRDEIVPATWLLYSPSGRRISLPGPESGYASEQQETIDVIQRTFTPLVGPTTEAVFHLQQ